MKDQWIDYLQEYLAAAPVNNSTNALTHRIASFNILLPFGPTVTNDAAFERINEVIVTEGLDVMCYNAYTRSHKVDALLDGSDD